MALLDGPMRAVATKLIDVLGGTISLREPDPGGEPGKYNQAYSIKATPFEKTGGISIFRGGAQALPSSGYKFGISPAALQAKEWPLPKAGWEVIKGSQVLWIVDKTPVSSGDELAYLELLAIDVNEVLTGPQANHTVVTQRQERVRSATGAWVNEGWVTVKTIQPAWVMALSARTQEEYGRRGNTVTHKIFTSEDPGIGVNGRILFNGRPLRILSVVNELNASRLWIMEAEGSA